MSYDYGKLRGKITEMYGDQYAFAYAIGLSERSLSNKLNNRVGWKQKEINKACELLNIDVKDIPVYFFNYEVQSN